MSTEIQERTFKRGYRILILWQWAKRSNCTDFEEITDHAVLRFFCSRKTAETYAKEVLLRLSTEGLVVRALEENQK